MTCLQPALVLSPSHNVMLALETKRLSPEGEALRDRERARTGLIDFCPMGLPFSISPCQPVFSVFLKKIVTKRPNILVFFFFFFQPKRVTSILSLHPSHLLIMQNTMQPYRHLPCLVLASG